jgi:hypothetical protein
LIYRLIRRGDDRLLSLNALFPLFVALLTFSATVIDRDLKVLFQNDRTAMSSGWKSSPGHIAIPRAGSQAGGFIANEPRTLPPSSRSFHRAALPRVISGLRPRYFS